MSKATSMYQHTKMNNFLNALCITILLSGCTKESNIPSSEEAVISPVTPEIVTTHESQPGNRGFTEIEQCAKELQALKSANPQMFNKLQSQFDQMISTVNKYSKVRPSLKLHTQDTIEALYTYKVSRICNDIEQNLLEGLTSIVSLKSEGGHK